MGAPRKYETEEELWGMFEDYVEENEDNPVIKQEAIKSGHLAGTTMDVPTPRPLSIEGFCAFLGVSTVTWYTHWEKENLYPNIVPRVRDIIKQHQLDGSACGLYNPVIVSRWQGLTEKTEITSPDIAKAYKILTA